MHLADAFIQSVLVHLGYIFVSIYYKYYNVFTIF